MTEAAAAPRLPIARFRIRIDEARVRAAPARDLRGAPFAGPPVDLDRDAARAIVALAAPIAAWMDAVEPGAVLRSIAVDVGTGGVVATLAGAPRPRVLRIAPADAAPIADHAAPIVRRLEALVAAALAARGQVPAAET